MLTTRTRRLLVLLALGAALAPRARALAGSPELQRTTSPVSPQEISADGAPQDISVPASPQAPSEPQAPLLRFERISIEQGLIFSVVHDVLQDRQGFLWIATDRGLNRYDGYRFEEYRHNPDDPRSLSHEGVLKLFEDHDGQLWLGTRAGLDRLDRDTNTFVHYTGLGGTQVLAIYEDRSGTLWIGSKGGLKRLDPGSDTLTTFWTGSPVTAILEDRNGDFWLAAAGCVERLDRATGTSKAHLACGLWFSALYEDRQGTLWAASQDNGLARWDASSQTFARYVHDSKDPGSLCNDVVTALLEDSAGRFWVGTVDGLDLFDRAQNRFLHYRYDPLDPNSLSDNLVLCLYEDRSGVVWIGTLRGLSKYAWTGNRFALYSRLATLPADSNYAVDVSGQHSLGADIVMSVCQDRNGVLWVGTFGAGLNRLDRAAGRLSVYQPKPSDPGSLPSELVEAVFEASDGTLWVGTGEGLCRFDPRTETFSRKWGLDTAPAEEILSITEDASGDLWVGTSGRLYRLDRAAGGAFRSYPGYALDPIPVAALRTGQDGTLWVGTLGAGLVRWDGARWTRYPHNATDAQSISSFYVISICLDARSGDGAVWVGTDGGGLNRLDPVTGTFTHYTRAQGLPGDRVSSILADADGFLWLGTDRGLSRFDPRTGVFRNYDALDGLQSGEFVSAFRDQGGEMFFGGLGGLNAFDPQEVSDNPIPPPTVIRSLSLLGKPVRTDLPTGERITLSYSENDLTFEFAALDYHAPAKNQYAYKLEGVNADWVAAGTRRYADYSNLRPGQYVFRVKSANSDGVWAYQGSSVSITILPPFWETWWFRGSLALLLLGSAVAAYGLRVRGIEARRRELEQEVGQRTSELRSEIEQRLHVEETLRRVEREKAVAEERGRLARELHDAVTQTLFSASLIADVLPRLWERNREEALRRLEELRQLNRGALAEMRTLLLELRPSALEKADLGGLLRQLADSIASRARLPILVEADEGCAVPAEAKLAFYRIAQEALNNAVKHAHPNRVAVRLTCATGAVELRITDDGKGFDPSSTAAEHHGLRIMRERAEAIDATLSIDSQPDKGTGVVVTWTRTGGGQGE